MKRFFLAALALATLVSCSKDEYVKVHPSSAIAFGQAFVDNATRAAVDPSTTTSTLGAFDVWGFIDGGSSAGNVFNKERVTKTDGDWEYKNIQYWIPGKEYFFAAVSPVDDKNVTVTTAEGIDKLKLGLGTISFTNVDGSTDLIYAANGPIEGKASENEKVKFIFNHLLSKVKFTFINGFENENVKLEVTDIKMTAPGAGTIDLATEDWWMDNDSGTEVKKWNLDETKSIELDFGDATRGSTFTTGVECDKECLTIPALSSQEYEVTFNVALYMGNVLALENSLTSTITKQQLRIGYAYNFIAVLDSSNVGDNPLQPIEFDAEVKEWIKTY